MQTHKRLFRLIIIGVIFIIVAMVLFSVGLFDFNKETVIRASIDIGSGTTKLRVAEVNLKNHTVKKLLVNQEFSVPYHKALMQSTDSTFSREVMDQGLEAIQKAKKISQENGAKKVVAVATSAFRNAVNADTFVQEIQDKTGVRTFIIDQTLEGELAFEAVKAEVDTPETQMVVWDIGGGSLQLSMRKKGGGFYVYSGKEASEPFKNYIIETIQQKDSKQVTTPNPITMEEIEKALAHAKEIGDRVDIFFKMCLQDPNVKVYGAGGIFTFGVLPALKGQRPITQEVRFKAIKEMANKTNEELGGGDYADVKVSNNILILGMQEQLGIPEVIAIDVNTANGAFFYEPFWKEDLVSS